jgi:DNA polymerase
MNKLEVLNNLSTSYSNCTKCNLCNEGRNNVVFGYGSSQARILVIGKAPSDEEDREGIPHIGINGRVLDYLLASESGIPELEMDSSSFKRDKFFTWKDHYEVKNKLINFVYYTNIVLCKPPNRDPEASEVKACKDRLLETIYTIDPTIILSVGKVPTSLLMGKVVTITKMRGQIFDFYLQGKANLIAYPVMPILDPYELCRNRESIKKNSPWKLTIKDIRDMYDLLRKYDGG